MFAKLNHVFVKRPAAFLVVVLLAGGLAVSAKAWANRVTVSIANESSFEIYHVYMSSSGVNVWGPDLLGATILRPGYSLPVTAVPGRYDLKLVDEDGDSCEVPTLSVYDNTSWRITDPWLLACEVFH